MLAKQGKPILGTGEIQLKNSDFQQEPSTRLWYPKKVELILPKQLAITLEVQEIIDAQDLLAKKNSLIKFLAKKLLRINPGYFRFLSQGQVHFLSESGSTIEESKVLHEMVFLK